MSVATAAEILSLLDQHFGKEEEILFAEHHESLMWLKEHGFKVNPEIELHDERRGRDRKEYLPLLVEPPSSQTR